MWADYDKLQDGLPWPKQLHEALARCHAGLVLLTKNALTSDWVLKEATILTWRQALDSNFRVFVALDKTNVNANSLKEHRYGPLSIPTIQRIDSLDPATVVDHVRKTLGTPQTPPTLFDHLVQRLTDLLRGVETNAFKDLAQKLGVDPPPWDPAQDQTARYIEAAARRLMSESLGGFSGVDDVIGVLASESRDRLNRILEYLAPYWVDAEVAGRLRALAKRTPPGAAALNATLIQHSGLMHIRRAHHMGFDFLVPEVAGGDSGQTAPEIGAQICKFMRDRKYSGPKDTDEAIRKRLAKWPKPVYVLLPEPVDADVLTDLRVTFPTLVFVMPSGESIEPDPSFTDVDWLRPPLDPDVENREFDSFNAANAIISNKISNQ